MRTRLTRTVIRLTPARHWSETALAPLLLPLHRFVHEARAGGVLLFLATLVALVLANSPWHHSFEALLHTPLGISLGGNELKLSLAHWINDGLMALYFFVVGLEIKREFVMGELSNPRAALLPVAAAFGGALVPALIYLAFNYHGAGQSGWAIPMATDIAFTLGALTLVGSRVPLTLKIFLTAVAIVDDLIAVLVIACFYSGSIHWGALELGLLFLLILLTCNYLGIWNLSLYTVLGIVVWGAFLHSGVHATVAGVLVAWCLPARSRIDGGVFREGIQQILDTDDGDEQVRTASIQRLERLCEGAQAPLQRAEHSLGRGAALFIVPIFALANAGVPFSVQGLSGENLPIALGIILGLLLGKPIGLMLSCWSLVRLGWGQLPSGTTWKQMLGATILAGIGFTMSIFVSNLAFTNPAVLAVAKSAILIASGLAMVCGVLTFVWLSPQTTRSDFAESQP